MGTCMSSEAGATARGPPRAAGPPAAAWPAPGSAPAAEWGAPAAACQAIVTEKQAAAAGEAGCDDGSPLDTLLQVRRAVRPGARAGWLPERAAGAQGAPEGYLPMPCALLLRAYLAAPRPVATVSP